MDSFESKTKQVEEHLKKYGRITSWDAIQQYRATRLSAIIFNLRKKYEIDTVNRERIDSYGRKTRFGEYILKGELV